MKMLALSVGILGCGWGLAPVLLITSAWFGCCWCGVVGLDSACEGTTLMLRRLLFFVHIYFPTPQRSRQFKCSGPFCDFRLDCLLLYWGPSVLDKRVKTDPIAVHLGLACAQAMPPFPKLRLHTHGKWNYYKKVTTNTYNMTLKAICFPLSKINEESLSKVVKRKV